MKSLSVAASIRTLVRVFLRLDSKSKFFKNGENRGKIDGRELTLNFLMFHEVTKPYEEEKNARVEVVFQHPKHDGEAK